MMCLEFEMRADGGLWSRGLPSEVRRCVETVQKEESKVKGWH